MPTAPRESVLHVIGDLAYGGAATQLALLVEHEARQGRAHAVLSLRYPGDAPRRLAAPVVWIGARWAIDPFALVRLRRQLRLRRPTLVQTWDHRSALMVSLLQRGFRWSHVVRGGGPIEPGDLLAVRHADRLLAAEPEHAQGLCDLGADRAKVRVVPNAVGTPAPNAIDRGGVLARWGIADGEPLVVAAMRLDNGALQKELPWAADLVRVVRPKVRMVIVGDGPHRAACERFTAEAAEPGTIVFAGPRSDWADLLGVADLAWCLSASPGAPTPLLEALGAAKPVVVSMAPGRERLIAPGKTGWLTAATDRAGWARASERVLNDPAGAARIATAGRDAALARHAIDRVAGAWRDALA